MLWIPVLLALALSLLTLRPGRRRPAAPPPARWPPATLIVPVKGHDEGLRENLAALASLDYPDYELIVCARERADLPAGAIPASARIVYALPLPSDASPHTGEKIQNLLAAIGAARPESEILAFADSDARPAPGWLKALAAELEDPQTGAATGYRWYLPRRGFTSHLRAAWNAVIAGGFFDAEPQFCWGGATAIRRQRFDQLRVRDYWRGHLSDDYRLSQAIRDAQLRIAFAPGALTPARDHATLAEFLEWIRRQLLLTRVHRPDLWRLALIAHLIYCAGMISALVLATPASLACLTGQLLSGIAKAKRRQDQATLLLGESARSFAQLALVPLATWAWLCAILASAFGRRMSWRGVRYRLTPQGSERLGP